MNDRSDAQRGPAVQALLDAVLDLAPAEREGYLAGQAETRPDVVADVRVLLAASATRESAHPPLDAAADAIVPDGLPFGTRVGAFQVVELVGRGGMGEVYRAERADGQFQQVVALKLIRAEAVDQLGRFHEERRLLARLDHPGIARLVDGGVAPDGRPYMAMEWVDGHAITRWCRDHDADLATRLALFVQVCDAVGHAHRNLLVHRDIKPGNVMVTPDGRAKLLDFGIAKLLGANMEQTLTAAAPMTPAYAAPEQLAHEPITTATDVYALGLLLFEMLTGTRPWYRPDMSMPTLFYKLMNETVAAPSVVVSRQADPPVAPKALRGDLDAIVGYALRREPERRYGSADELGDDLRRHLERRPVLARPDSVRYQVATFVRRNRASAAFAVVALAALVIGLATALWQAHQARVAAHQARVAAHLAQTERTRAEHEAERARATRDFLVRVFKASDPRVAQDKPRGQITAKELLDVNAPKIAQEFRDDPETQIELLGQTAMIYRELGDEARYRTLRDQQSELARSQGGDAHPAIIGRLLDDASYTANVLEDPPEANRLLDDADPLIHQAGLDHSESRARWWVQRANTLADSPTASDLTVRDLNNAIDLYRELGSESVDYVEALYLLGMASLQADPAAAERAMQTAIEVSGHVKDMDDTGLARIHEVLAQAREAQDNFDGAASAYRQALELGRRTTGEGSSQYWMTAANFGNLLFQQGRREEVHALFDHLLPIIPADWTLNWHGEYTREAYAWGLVAEGQPVPAIPLLEHALKTYRAQQVPNERNVDRAEWRLAVADAEVGRAAEARAIMQPAIDRLMAAPGTDTPRALLRRERWGRFLLDQGDIAPADEQFRGILAQANGRSIAPVALATGDAARVALARNDVTAAVAGSRAAVEMFDRISGPRDVRGGPYLWLIQADALLRAGDRIGARRWAARALEASQRYDAPGAASIGAARDVLARCDAGPRN